MANFELKKDLELVEVVYENEGKKAVLTFLNKDAGEIREVNFNRQVYKDGKYVDSEDKAAKVDEWCKEHFKVKFDKLSSCIGQKKDVYCYQNFSSLFEVDMVEKFTEAQKGKMYQTEIKEILVDELFIKVRYEIEGKLYESKQACCKYIEAMQQYYPDPVKREKELKKFEDKFGVPIEEKDSLVGAKLIVEVKSAFGKYYYGDLKPMPN